MWIKQVELKNIKSYGEAQTIRFKSGINAICGPNGAGKSTVLEAIGLALFDTPPYRPLRQFVREGAKRGEIVVTFVDTRDEREYQVVYPVGSGSPYIYDPETKQKSPTGKADVKDWLNDHLSVGPTADLKALFANAIGVPQGLLTAPFLERADTRKKKFDQLLQVDDYKKASKELGETSKYLGKQLQAQERKCERLRGQLVRLPSLQQENETLRRQLALNEQKLADTTSRLEVVTSDIKAFNQLKAKQQQLAGQLARVDERLRGVEKRLLDAQKAVWEAKKARDIVAQTESGHQAYRTAQAGLQELERQRGERDWLREQLNRLERELDLVNRSISDYRGKLAEITNAEAQLIELAPLVAKQEQLEVALREAEQERMQWQHARRQLAWQEDRLAEQQGELAQVQASLEERQRLEQEVEGLLSLHEQQYETSKNLGHQLSALEKESRLANERLTEAQQTVWQWQEAQRGLQQAERQLSHLQAKKREVLAQLQRRAEVESLLERLQEERQRQQEQQAALNAEKPMLQDQHRALEKRLAVLREADEAHCPVCQQTLTIERAHDLTAHYHTEQQALTERQRVLRQQQRSLTTELKRLSAEQQRLNRELNRLPNPNRKDELSLEIERQQARVTQWQEEVAALSGAQAIAETAHAECIRLDVQIQSLEQKQTALNQSRRQLGQQLYATQARIAKLPRPEREQEIAGEINNLRAAIADWHNQVESLRDAPQRVILLQTQLRELGNPRQKQQLLKAKTEGRQTAEKKLAAHEKRQDRLQKDRSETDAALQAYAALERTIAEQHSLRSQYESDHYQYLSHQQLAQTLPERQDELARLANQKQNETNERDEILADLATVQANYNETQHQALSDESRQLMAQQAQLIERLNYQNMRVTELKDDLAHLGQLQVELSAASEKEQEWAELVKDMEFMRKTIKEAGPYVTRRLVQTISIEANQLFGDLMDNHAMELEWSEDYTINVTYKGEKRSFQQLSGGEQMAAALAVRLALLHEMSDIRLAFFDEPTAHLDHERRENLAAQITRIKGFKQLFVISHDDTFERETYNLLRVSKNNGFSQVSVA